MCDGEDEAERADQHDRGELRERLLAAPDRGRRLRFPEPGTPSCRRPDWAGGGRSYGLAAGKQCPAVVK